MDPFLLLACSVALAVTNNLLLHGFGNRGLRGTGDVLLFNALVSSVWLVILTAVSTVRSGAFPTISRGAALWGILYGGVTAAFLLCKMQAMASGPVSLTSFIGCASLLLSTAVGVLAFHESVTPLQLTGVVLLIVSLFLAAAPKTDRAKKTWKLWCALFFVCSGAVGIIFKLHQRSPVKDEIDEMMICAAVTSAVLFALAAIPVQRKEDRAASRAPALPRVPKSALPFALVCGAVSCGYNRLNIPLSGTLPSIVFYPCFNGSVILLASLFAALLFREKLKKTQYAGLILGAASLMLTAGVVDGLLKIFRI